MSKTTLMWVVGIGITIYLANNANSANTTQTQTSFMGGLLTGGFGAGLLFLAL